MQTSLAYLLRKESGGGGEAEEGREAREVSGEEKGPETRPPEPTATLDSPSQEIAPALGPTRQPTAATAGSGPSLLGADLVSCGRAHLGHGPSLW